MNQQFEFSIHLHTFVPQYGTIELLQDFNDNIMNLVKWTRDLYKFVYKDHVSTKDNTFEISLKYKTELIDEVIEILNKCYEFKKRNKLFNFILKIDDIEFIGENHIELQTVLDFLWNRFTKTGLLLFQLDPNANDLLNQLEEHIFNKL